ncbi:MAG: hypothetical protein LBL43_01210 [Treponema sp.]|jgi:hypothetical protein|nr:hypothetical protein [Treponema sp.]
MITLEQIKLLESGVGKAVDLVKKLGEENLSLKVQLEAEKKRAGEIEGQNRRLKAEQSRIEEGILLTLEKLNQFEDAVEQSLKGQGNRAPAAGKAASTGKPEAEKDAPLPPAAADPGEGPDETPVPAEAPVPAADFTPEDPSVPETEPEQKEGEELDLF